MVDGDGEMVKGDKRTTGGLQRAGEYMENRNKNALEFGKIIE